MIIWQREERLGTNKDVYIGESIERWRELKRASSPMHRFTGKSRLVVVTHIEAEGVGIFKKKKKRKNPWSESNTGKLYQEGFFL